MAEESRHPPVTRLLRRLLLLFFVVDGKGDRLLAGVAQNVVAALALQARGFLIQLASPDFKAAKAATPSNGAPTSAAAAHPPH